MLKRSRDEMVDRFPVSECLFTGDYMLCPARHEWVKNYERMTNEQYQKYFENFNPDSFIIPKNGHGWPRRQE